MFGLHKSYIRLRQFFPLVCSLKNNNDWTYYTLKPEAQKKLFSKNITAIQWGAGLNHKLLSLVQYHYLLHHGWESHHFELKEILQVIHFILCSWPCLWYCFYLSKVENKKWCFSFGTGMLHTGISFSEPRWCSYLQYRWRQGCFQEMIFMEEKQNEDSMPH